MISIGNLQINKLFLGNLEVAKAYLGDVEVYGSKQKPEGKYMTITVSDGASGTVISPTVTGTLSPNLQYRINRNGDWNDFIVGTTADIHVRAGDWVQFKGNNTSGLSIDSSNYMNFAISGNPVALSGNVMSLIDGVGDALVIPRDYCFYRLFHGSSIKTVSPDFLPATTLTNGCYFDLFSGSLLENAPELPSLTMKDNCYRGMFYGCQHFTQAPALPATTLANDCYAFMLAECSSLVQAPALHATELATECYRGLFQNCTSLTQATALPATTLSNYCYQNMFSGCTALATAPEILPATTLANNCYYQMFNGCTSLVKAPALPATTLVSNCYKSMFYNCTALTKAPELPATTLADNCYQFMFWGCSNLTQAPALPATTLAIWCYEQMFCNCTSLTQAPELPATTLTDYCYRWMFYGDSKLNYVKSLATDITATNALYQWLSGVASSGTFVKPAGVSYVTGDSGIPSGWTVVEEKPKPEGKYMTITVDDSVEGETIISPRVNGDIRPNLQYRINSNGDWSDFIVGTTADIHVVAGDFVQFKGVNPNGISTNINKYLYFSISGLFHLSGNVMSLIDGIGETLVIPCDFCFYNMFSSNLKTVSSDFLPATELKHACYIDMFSGCTSLTQAPALPATTLAESCYSRMFNGCTSLVNAPELPATTLDESCYQSMFQGCTSLENAPALPANTMYFGCYSGMFEGCTSLTKAPELPATTLNKYCYSYMFRDCTSLNYVKCRANRISASSYSLQNWLENVSPTGTFVKRSGVSYPSGASGIPAGWTIQNI